MTEKYVNGKWADPKQKHDPMFLFENRPKKFDRWVKKLMQKAEAKVAPVDDDSSDEEIKPSKKVKLLQTEKPSRRRQQNFQDIPPPQKPVAKPTAPTNFGDLISFGSKPAEPDFGDFHDSAPAVDNDGFGDFNQQQPAQQMNEMSRMM